MLFHKSWQLVPRNHFMVISQLLYGDKLIAWRKRGRVGRGRQWKWGRRRISQLWSSMHWQGEGGDCWLWPLLLLLRRPSCLFPRPGCCRCWPVSSAGCCGCSIKSTIRNINCRRLVVRLLHCLTLWSCSISTWINCIVREVRKLVDVRFRRSQGC